jgi:anti-sigma B factor antagonist
VSPLPGDLGGAGGIVRAMSAEVTRLDLSDDVDGTLVLVGEIDSHTAPALAERLSEAPETLVIDLAGVSFIDSSGLRILVEAHQARLDADASLTLRSPSAAVQRLLEISGLSSHLDVTG